MSRVRAVTARRLELGAVVLTALVITGCSGGSPPAPPPPTSSTPTSTTVTSEVPLPPPDQRGPTITIGGEANWTGRTPGCVLLRTDSGQVFQLTGQPVSTHLGEVRSGTAAPQQRMHVTGYIPEVGASVCGAVRAFVVEKVTAEER